MLGRFRRSEEVVGFAFSGGGSRAAAQVGILKSLTEAGIRPALVAGTSAGAVNAAYFALHPNRLDRLEAIWLALRMRDVFPGSRLRLLVNLARRGHVHASDAWERFLRAEIGTTHFEDLSIACSVVAVRLRDGEKVVFESGEILPALMASTAIPGVFPPFDIGGESYVDGGVVEYLPLPTLLERGATTVFAMDCSSYSHIPVQQGSVVDRCARIAARSTVMQMASLRGMRGRTMHLLQPDLPDFEDARDFGHTSELVLAGHEHANKYLQNLVLTRHHAAGTEPTPHAG
jgi:NTE family protein